MTEQLTSEDYSFLYQSEPEFARLLEANGIHEDSGAPSYHQLPDKRKPGTEGEDSYENSVPFKKRRVITSEGDQYIAYASMALVHLIFMINTCKANLQEIAQTMKDAEERANVIQHFITLNQEKTNANLPMKKRSTVQEKASLTFSVENQKELMNLSANLMDKVIQCTKSIYNLRSYIDGLHGTLRAVDAFMGTTRIEQKKPNAPDTEPADVQILKPDNKMVADQVKYCSETITDIQTLLEEFLKQSTSTENVVRKIMATIGESSTRQTDKYEPNEGPSSGVGAPKSIPSRSAAGGKTVPKTDTVDITRDGEIVTISPIKRVSHSRNPSASDLDVKPITIPLEDYENWKQHQTATFFVRKLLTPFFGRETLSKHNYNSLEEQENALFRLLLQTVEREFPGSTVYPKKKLLRDAINSACRSIRRGKKSFDDKKSDQN